MTLRPIGTEIEIFFPPSPHCSAQRFTIWKYRIKAHAETNQGPMETLDPISKREFAPTLYAFWMGRLTPVPPRECLPFLDAGWHALFAAYPQS